MASAVYRLREHPTESARAARLRYVDSSRPGIRRIRSGRGFRYQTPDGKTLHDPEVLQRIRALVIPPAWTDVWICPANCGHIQAVGWDARGRKQYRYHAHYREVRDKAKFSRMIAFGTVLADIRRQVAKDLRRRGLPRDKVLAGVVRLLETTHMRVGNEEYARENDSFGLTTLRNRHVHISGTKLRFDFRGKSGQQQNVQLTDRELARVIRECQDLPGFELFQYIDGEGRRRAVGSTDVNRYLHRIAGEEFTAKDFRTWGGTVLAARELTAAGPPTSATDAKQKIVAAVKSVARQLGNRPATCRKYYIHPAMLEAYANESLFDAVHLGQEQEKTYKGKGLTAEEYAVMVIIAEDLAKSAGLPTMKTPRPRRAA